MNILKQSWEKNANSDKTYCIELKDRNQIPFYKFQN